MLLYGVPGPGRLGAFQQLCNHGLTCVFLCGLYGPARDELIARSKMIVNIALYERSKIFEVVRVSYLMANRKAVVADVDADTVIDADVAAGIRTVSAGELVAACKDLAADAAARERLQEAAFRSISQRDIRRILAEVID